MGVNVAQPNPYRFDVMPANHPIFVPRWTWFWNGSGSTLTYGHAAEVDLSVTTHGRCTAVKVHAAESDDRGKIVGLVMRTTANLAWVPIQFSGYFGDPSQSAPSATNGALVDGATAAGDLLYGDIDAGAAGSLLPQSGTYSAAHRVVAWATEDDTSNRARVILLNPLGLG